MRITSYVNLFLGRFLKKKGIILQYGAPRQTGKSWTMREILWLVQEDERFDILKINLEVLKTEENTGAILKYIDKHIANGLNKDIVNSDTPDKFTDRPGYKEALKKAANYGKQLGLKEISLIFFVESIDDESREKYETDFDDPATGVSVAPIFVETGN